MPEDVHVSLGAVYIEATAWVPKLGDFQRDKVPGTADGTPLPVNFVFGGAGVTVGGEPGAVYRGSRV